MPATIKKFLLALLLITIHQVGLCQNLTYSTTSNPNVAILPAGLTLNLPFGDTVYIGNISAYFAGATSIWVQACPAFGQPTVSCPYVLWESGPPNEIKFEVKSYTFTVDGKNRYGLSVPVGESTTGNNSFVFFIQGLSGVGFTDTYSVSDKLRVFPNPVNDRLSIESNELMANKFVIYNSIGEIVKTCELKSNNVNVDVRDLLSGVYYLCFYNDTRIVAHKKLFKD